MHADDYEFFKIALSDLFYTWDELAKVALGHVELFLFGSGGTKFGLDWTASTRHPQ